MQQNFKIVEREKHLENISKFFFLCIRLFIKLCDRCDLIKELSHAKFYNQVLRVERKIINI